MKSNQSPKKALHFETMSYPRFGRGLYSDEKAPRTVRNSPFFWWFKFLQLNSDYVTTEKAKGVGVCSDLYKDFGDVSNKDFKTWWQEHSHLFAEQESAYKMKVAHSDMEIAPYNSNEVVNVVVPLSWSQKSLKKHFAMLLNKLGVEQSKRGPKIGSETAKYSLGRRWNCGAMESAYKVYIARQANMEKGAKETKKAQHKGEVSSKFKVAWADIADMAKIIVSNKDNEGSYRTKGEVRRLQTILAVRHYENAESFIESSATASFPSSLKD
jgi:hypothetical protein